ncbi:hypothetical protein SLE2022_155650 [Rubroshorea leprosula]
MRRGHQRTLESLLKLTLRIIKSQNLRKTGGLSFQTNSLKTSPLPHQYLNQAPLLQTQLSLHLLQAFDPLTPEARKNRTQLLVGISTAALIVISTLGFSLFSFWRMGAKGKLDVLACHMSFDDVFGNHMGPREFSYDELAKATKNFADHEEKLGEGEFGAIYEGFLRDQMLQLKGSREDLNKGSRNTFQK